MPEKDALDTLLRKGDPVDSFAEAQSQEERYARLLPKLAEAAPRPRSACRRWRGWLALPAIGAVVAAMLLLQPKNPPAPQPTVAPSVERVAIVPTPTPRPIIKPTPAAETAVEKRVVQETPRPRLRAPQRRYRLKQRVAKGHHPRRKRATKVLPVAPPPAERIVIERSFVPASRVAVVISGSGDNLSVTHALIEEKS